MYLLHLFSLGVSLCCNSVFSLNYCPFLNVGIRKLRTQELTAVSLLSVISSLT